MKKLIGYCEKCKGVFGTHDYVEHALLKVIEISEAVNNNPKLDTPELRQRFELLSEYIGAEYEASRWLGKVLEPMNSIFK